MRNRRKKKPAPDGRSVGKALRQEMTVAEVRAAGLDIPKAGKYKSRRCVVDGLTFDSKREAKRWEVLKLLQKEGLIRELTRQVTYRFEINGVHVCSYRSDFEYLDEGGARVVEDAKGFRTPEYKIKKKLMLAVYRVSIKEV